MKRSLENDEDYLHSQKKKLNIEGNELLQERMKTYEAKILANRLLKRKQHQKNKLKVGKSSLNPTNGTKEYVNLESYKNKILSNRLLISKHTLVKSVGIKCLNIIYRPIYIKLFFVYVNCGNKEPNDVEEDGNDSMYNWLIFKDRAFTAFDLNWKTCKLLKIGKMSTVCRYCKAVRFEKEWQSLCCGNGKVKIDDLCKPPKLLRDLLSGQHYLSSHFMTYIRAYNNAFSFTSFGTTVINDYIIFFVKI